jgi:hypothetical protein
LDCFTFTFVRCVDVSYENELGVMVGYCMYMLVRYRQSANRYFIRCQN